MATRTDSACGISAKLETITDRLCRIRTRMQNTLFQMQHTACAVNPTLPRGEPAGEQVQLSKTFMCALADIDSLSIKIGEASQGIAVHIGV